jgi:hypothetical protein
MEGSDGSGNERSDWRSLARRPSCDAIYAHRFHNVFHGLNTRIDKLNRQSIADLIVGRTGNANTAGFSQSFKTSSDVYSGPEEVTVLDDYVADIYADPHEDEPIGR